MTCCYKNNNVLERIRVPEYKPVICITAGTIVRAVVTGKKKKKGINTYQIREFSSAVI